MKGAGGGVAGLGQPSWGGQTGAAGLGLISIALVQMFLH